MTVDVKPDEQEQEAAEAYAEMKREVKLSSELVTRAIAKVRTAVAAQPSEKSIAELRAAASMMKKTADRATKARRALLKAKSLTAEVREAEEAKELALEADIIDCEYMIEAFLRQHDANSFVEEDRRQSTSIQHESGASERPNLNSTTNSAQPAKNSWKEILQRVPKFAGDPTKFKRWRNAFELYVDSTSMDPLEKFQLMMKTLVGKVPECVAVWDVSADNYVDARDTIYDRYGDISLAEEQHVDNVLNACLRKDVVTDRKFIEFVDVVTHNMASIVNLGATYEGMSPFVTRVIMRALPFERKQRFDDVFVPSDDECRLKALLVFLGAERKQVERLVEKQKGSPKPQSEGRRAKFEFQNSQRTNASQFKRFEDRKFNPAGPSGSTGNQYSFVALENQSNKQQVDHACIFCSEKHPSNKCRKEMSIDERRRCVATKNACYKCLNRNHKVDKCRAKGCAKCRGRHHEMLCTKTDDIVTSASLTIASGFANANMVKMLEVAKRMIPTGFVEIIGDGRRTIGRIMLDTGSQKTLITNKLAEELNARTVAMDKFYLQTAGHAMPRKCKGRIVEITLKSRFSNNHMVVHATALKNVVEGELPRANFSGNIYPIADKNEDHWSEEISILIGADFLYPILGTTIKKIEGYLAIETAFGYFVSGTGKHQEIQVHPMLEEVVQRKKESWCEKANWPRETAVSLAAAIKAKFDPEDISFLWETELLGFGPSTKESDEASTEEVMRFFRETTKRDSNGRYIIQLPFKPNLNTLGSNRELTERRLRSFLAQARKNPKLLEAADAEIQDLLSQGFIEITTPPQPGEQAHYLPLLAVIKKQASAEGKLKVRLVNDASARSKDEAGLNDVLFQGGNLIADLISVILKFRQLEVVITADIEKAYLQNEIIPEQRKFLRFLWPLGISSNQRAPVKELQSCRLSFGLVSAPFLHCATIRLHLENEIKRRPKDAELLEFVKEYFYVDDLMAGAESVEHGKSVAMTLREVFDAGCFPLKKWATNSAELGL